MRKNSSLPWKIWDGWGPDKKGYYHAGRIGPAGGGFGLVPDAEGYAAEILATEEDFETVARSVNNHDGLIIALEELLEAIDNENTADHEWSRAQIRDDGTDIEYSKKWDEAVDNTEAKIKSARAALARAKGEE